MFYGYMNVFCVLEEIPQNIPDEGRIVIGNNIYGILYNSESSYIRKIDNRNCQRIIINGLEMEIR